MRHAGFLGLVLTLACRPASPALEPPTTPPSSTDTDAEPSPPDVNTPDTADTPEPQACGASTWTSGVYDIDHGGVARRIRVYVPSSYDPTVPAPLALVFHGWGGDDQEFLRAPVVTAEADAHGYVLIAPVGIGAGPSDRSWNSWSFRGSTTGLDGDGQPICDDDATTDYAYPSCDGVAANGCSWTHCQDDDVDFALQLVSLTSDNLCIDADSVFATGGSNGGMFTWELGQNEASAETFKAIAPIIGLPHRAYLDPPGRDGGMPVLLVTGMNDRTVPPGAWDDPSFTTTNDGDAYYYSGATAITQVWAEAAGCDVSGAAAPVDVGVTQAECRSHCDDASWPSVLDCRADMGHTYQLGWSWPLVLEFFDRQR